ncbi:Hypothetical predicted protein [Paramuricea clavata]|uniref:Uncharacterized protein n=1 Tax=Paramuricea clavata TaxID=317549 RepID=A0A6S7I0T4_PARCT|nr:Hypothetical predicted protein [Paramuricea clavata]
MAGNENEDWTDSPAVRVTNEPTESFYFSVSAHGDQSGVAEGEDTPNMGLYNNGIFF